MTFRGFGWALAAVLLLAGCSSSPGTKPVLLRLKAKPGDSFTVSYRVDTEYDFPGDGKGGPPSHESSFVELKKLYTCKAATDEKITWETKTISVVADGSGPLKGQSYEVIESERERVETLERNGQNKLVSKSKDNPLELLFPDGEVNVGDAWRGNINLQGNELVVTYHVEGFETVDGRKTVHIRGELSGDMQIRLGKPLHIWVDTSNGFPVKGHGQFLLEPPGGIKVQMDVKMTVS